MTAVANALQKSNVSFRYIFPSNFAFGNLNHSKPTLFLSECVLIYLHHQHSDALIQWISSSFDLCSICVYEQINPHDPFGKTMVQNLQVNEFNFAASDTFQKRGCPLLSLEKYPTLQDQKQRFLQLGMQDGFEEIIDMSQGWQRVEGHNLYHIYNNIIPKEHTRRWHMWKNLLYLLSQN